MKKFALILCLLGGCVSEPVETANSVPEFDHTLLQLMKEASYNDCHEQNRLDLIMDKWCSHLAENGIDTLDSEVCSYLDSRIPD